MGLQLHKASVSGGSRIPIIDSFSWVITTIMTFVLPSSLLLVHSGLTLCSRPGVDIDEPLLGEAA